MTHADDPSPTPALTYAEWREHAPRLVDECVEQWSLTAADPFPVASAGVTLDVRLADGSEAVLKVGFPHRESEHEADALALWDGNGAVRLLARDDERHAMLIERCRPGTPLAAAGAETGLDVLTGLLPRLWVRAAEPFHTLADEAAWWSSYLVDEWERFGKPFERRLIDIALDALATLPQTQGEQVLVHQDLHGDNVLAAEREPWLVIDPKPLLGEREFAVAPIVRSFEFGYTARDSRYRLDRLTSELELDRERARMWTIAQTVAWTFDSRYHENHTALVRWLLEG